MGFDTPGTWGNHEQLMHRQPKKVSLVILALVAAVLLLAPGAFGQTGDDPAGVDQYVEELPTGAGDKPSGGSDNGGGGRLATGVEQEVQRQGGDDAGLLTAIATSAAFGAPSERLRESAGGRTAGNPGSAEPDVSLPEALSSAVGSLAGGDGEGSALGLIVAVGAVTGAAVLAAFLRRRRRETS